MTRTPTRTDWPVSDESARPMAVRHVLLADIPPDLAGLWRREGGDEYILLQRATLRPSDERALDRDWGQRHCPICGADKLTAPCKHRPPTMVELQRDEAERLLLAMVREHGTGVVIASGDHCDAVAGYETDSLAAARAYLVRRGLLPSTPPATVTRTAHDPLRCAKCDAGCVECEGVECMCGGGK